MIATSPVASLYRIVYETGFPPRERDAWIVRMAIKTGDETVAIADVLLSRRLAGELMAHADLDSQSEARQAMVSILLRYAVQLLEDALREGWEPASQDFIVERDELPRLQAMLDEKTCRYKHREESRDLYCSVAGDADAVALGLRRLAPTSLALCNACSLPATDSICSHLHHPRVVAVEHVSGSADPEGNVLQTSDRTVRREVLSAICDRGRPEISQADQCSPGGNRCWERLVEPAAEQSAQTPPPLALPEALDFLDTTWQVAFGRSLFRARTVATDAALALEARTAADLEARLSKLDEVFNAIVIGDDLLPAGTSIDKGLTLMRLATCLKAELPSIADEMERAVGVFRAVKNIRAAVQHPERRSEMITAYSKLRLTWPSRNPGETWDGIRTRTIEAAAILRDAVRGLGPRAARTAQASGLT